MADETSSLGPPLFLLGGSKQSAIQARSSLSHIKITSSCFRRAQESLTRNAAPEVKKLPSKRPTNKRGSGKEGVNRRNGCPELAETPSISLKESGRGFRTRGQLLMN